MEGETKSNEQGEALLDVLNNQSRQKPGATCFQVSIFIVTREYVMVRAKMFAVLFHDNIVEGAFEHFDETTASAPGSSIVFDCIVCSIRRQNQWYNVKVFSSWKNGFYALKNGLLPTF